MNLAFLFIWQQIAQIQNQPAAPHSKECLTTQKADGFQVHCIIMVLFSLI